MFLVMFLVFSFGFGYGLVSEQVAIKHTARNPRHRKIQISAATHDTRLLAAIISLIASSSAASLSSPNFNWLAAAALFSSVTRLGIALACRSGDLAKSRVEITWPPVALLLLPPPGPTLP
jgi:hypothetical protein